MRKPLHPSLYQTREDRRDLRSQALGVVIPGLLLSLAFGWGGGGCASGPDKSSSSAPKPGSGIAEYREVARGAHLAVAATVTSLEALAAPSNQPLLQHPALPGFDRAFHRLELTSITARARADAIIARGQGYFDEWKANLSDIDDRAAAQTEAERYRRLFGHFEQIRERSGGVREVFRPFMTRLREFRARLDQPAKAPSGEAAQQEIKGLLTDGRRVLQTLDSVSTALNEAEVELRATLAAKP